MVWHILELNLNPISADGAEICLDSRNWVSSSSTWVPWGQNCRSLAFGMGARNYWDTGVAYQGCITSITLPHHIIPLDIIPHDIIPHDIIPHGIIPLFIIPYHTTWYHITWYHITWYHTTWYHTTTYHTTWYRSTWYHTTWHHTMFQAFRFWKVSLRLQFVFGGFTICIWMISWHDITDNASIAMKVNTQTVEFEQLLFVWMSTSEVDIQEQTRHLVSVPE